MFSPEERIAIIKVLDYCERNGGPCFKGWKKLNILDYLMYHASKGTLLCAWDKGEPSGVVTWWRLSDTPTEELLDNTVYRNYREVKDVYEGSNVYHDVAICTHKDAWKQMMDVFKALVPDWMQLTYYAVHKERLRTYSSKWRFRHG